MRTLLITAVALGALAFAGDAGARPRQSSGLFGDRPAKEGLATPPKPKRAPRVRPPRAYSPSVGRRPQKPRPFSPPSEAHPRDPYTLPSYLQGDLNKRFREGKTYPYR